MTDPEYAECVRANYDRFRRFVSACIRSSADAEDVLQGALLRLWLHRDSIEAARPDGYFFQALRNAIWDHFRHRPSAPAGALEHVPDPRAGESEDDPPDTGTDEAGRLLAAVLQEFTEQRSQLHLPGALERLEDACTALLCSIRQQMSEQQRQVFAASLLADGSQARAQAMLNLPRASTYPNALFRARGWFRRMLAPYGQALVDVLGPARLLELIRAAFCEVPGPAH